MRYDDHPHRPARRIWLGYLLSLVALLLLETWWVGSEIREQTGEFQFFALAITESGSVGGLSRVAGGLFLIAAVLGGAWVSRRVNDEEWLHGSARFSSWNDLEDAELLGSRGIVLGQVLSPVLRRHVALRHAGTEHVLVLGETRAGKTSEQLIPTLLSWTGDVVVVDPKGSELYLRTSGWLSRTHRILRFDPVRGDTRWNCMDEVQPGASEVGELQILAEALIPTRPKDEHFVLAGRQLWVGLALHTLYSGGRRSIAGTRDLLMGQESSSPGKSGVHAIAEQILAADHDPQGVYGWTDPEGNLSCVHPEAARIARWVLATPDKELGSIVSTVSLALQPWSDSRVVTATDASDVALSRIRLDPKPSALFVSVPLEDLDRLKGLLRVLLTVVAKKLCETGIADGGPMGLRRVLVVVDEFPALGKLDYIGRMLSTLAAFGVTFVIAVQTYSQLKSLYGASESISGGCPFLVASATKDIETLKFLQTLVGETTIVRKQVSRSSGNLQSAGQSTTSSQQVRRPLLTQGELRTLPKDRGLVIAPKLQPILTKKRGYFRDPELNLRSVLPAAQGEALSAESLWDGEQPLREELTVRELLADA